ncbi:MAG: type II toxin-antitoxin system VapC family toxin [Ktedonobacteraceae bacterium]
MQNYVLDASALLALLNQEPGSERVAGCIANGAMISTVNLSEVVAKLSDAGVPEEVIREALSVLGIVIVDFDTLLAYGSGLLRPLTRQAGLSLGDRACLALARRFELPAVTTDKAWGTFSSGVVVQLIR